MFKWLLKARVGQLEPVILDDGTQQKIRKKAFIPGVILEAIGAHEWLVQFENGTHQQLKSNQIVFVSSSCPPPGESIAGGATAAIGVEIQAGDNRGDVVVGEQELARTRTITRTSPR